MTNQRSAQVIMNITTPRTKMAPGNESTVTTNRFANMTGPTTLVAIADSTLHAEKSLPASAGLWSNASARLDIAAFPPPPSEVSAVEKR